MRPMKERAPGSPHDALAKLMTEIGNGSGDGVQMAADFEGKSVFTLYKMLDPDQEPEMSFARVARLTAHFKVLAAADHLASLCGGRVIRLPQVDAADCDMAALCDLASKSSDAIGEFGRARGDGQWTVLEAQAVRRELGELLISILQVDARLALIERGEGAP